MVENRLLQENMRNRFTVVHASQIGWMDFSIFLYDPARLQGGTIILNPIVA